MKKQGGFAILEAFMLLVIVAIVGGIGWYVWQTNKNNAGGMGDNSIIAVVPIDNYEDCLKSKLSKIDKKAFPHTCESKAGKKFTDPNPFANWKTYTSEAGKYTLKHPKGWNEDVCDQGATDLTLYLGPTKASSVICNSEHFSQILVVSTSAVPTKSEQELGSSYSNQTSKKIVVDGVTGERQSGITRGGDFVGIPKGTLVVRYFFLKPGRNYILAYVQTPSGDFAQNNLAIFDQMVQKTLNFN